MNWTIDTAHSTLGFSVRHMMFTKVRGTFEDWTASLELDPQDVEASTVEVTIQAASIDTRNEKRDGHLRSADFFDTEVYPTLRFVSTQIQAQSDSRFTLTGELTIRDQTHPVTLEVTRTGSGQDPWGNRRIGYSASTTISRKDFGLTWNQALETGGVLVGDTIAIDLEVQAVGQAVEKSAAA